MNAPTNLAGLVVDQHVGLFGETASATFSPDREYRYALTRRWQGDRPLAAFVMCNPSTADAFTVDPTIRRCIGFARSSGAGGLIVLNLFGLRSTNPKALYTHPDPVGPDNDLVIADQFSVRGELVGPVVCAWGVHGALHGRGARIAALLRARGVRPLCLGVTKDGHPLHPLYLPRSAATVDLPAQPTP